VKTKPKNNLHSLKEHLFVLKQFTSYLKPYRNYLIVVFLALMFVASSILSLGYALKLMIDSGFGGHDAAILNKAFYSFVFIIILLSLASYTRASVINLVCEKLSADIKKDVYKHIIRLSPGFFETNKTSDIISRLTVDTAILNSVIATISSSAIRNFLMMVGGMALLFLNSPKLTMYVLVIVPVVLVPIIFFAKRIRKYSLKNQASIAILSSHIEETLNGVKTVQSFCREDFESTSFSQKVDEALKIASDRIQARAILAAIVILAVLLSITTVLWVGGHDVLNGNMSSGSLSTFIFYSILVATSMGALSELVGDISRAAASAERILELLKIESDVKSLDKSKKLRIKDITSLEFKDVCFAYPSQPDKEILKKINFTICGGESIAIVGQSGSGKSTIFQLLLRFYDPQQGKILLNGNDIKDYSIQSLRELFAYVPQEPMIFSAPAYDNILFGNPEASPDKVDEAAKIAQIYDYIQTLPKKYQTFLGEKGVRLSGGQRQRLAIARAIIKNPKILLLDEATSALDSRNEKLVQKALKLATVNKTTITIAHRISTIKDADTIIVINNGEVEEIGDTKLIDQKT
jgi:ATP-binding cassette, subfamily B, bacterial